MFLSFAFFFAFMVMGVQNVCAQNYVQNAEALVIVQAEIQSIQTATINQTTQEKTQAFAAQATKLEFLQAVEIHLLDGEATPDAIIHGVHDAGFVDYVTPPAPKGIVNRAPLHQEIVDLLSL